MIRDEGLSVRTSCLFATSALSKRPTNSTEEHLQFEILPSQWELVQLALSLHRRFSLSFWNQHQESTQEHIVLHDVVWFSNRSKNMEDSRIGRNSTQNLPGLLIEPASLKPSSNEVTNTSSSDSTWYPYATFMMIATALLLYNEKLINNERLISTCSPSLGTYRRRCWINLSGRSSNPFKSVWHSASCIGLYVCITLGFNVLWRSVLYILNLGLVVFVMNRLFFLPARRPLIKKSDRLE